MLDSAGIGILVCLLALIVASIFDWKTREVPDWISFSLTAFAIGYSIILSVFHQTSWFFWNSITGLLIALAVGLLMFYTGQWGGGDSKLIIGVCAIIGFSIPGLSRIESQHSMLAFFVNTLVVGAVYGIAYSLGIAITKISQVAKEAKELLKQRRLLILRAVLLAALVISIIYKLLDSSLISTILVVITSGFIIIFYTWILVSCIEKVHMIKIVKIAELTEGDWITKSVVKKSKVILMPPKTGLSLEDIELLKKNKIDEVEIKIGIPFVPSFLIAFILTITLGNWLAYFI